MNEKSNLYKYDELMYKKNILTFFLKGKKFLTYLLPVVNYVKIVV
jgi:hypothetical protein